jgi:ClpP class serine protease
MTNASTLNRVERACVELRQDGEDVTFTAVATRTGLGRSTLYRDPLIRAVIAEHRHRTATSGTVAGLTDEIATLRTALDALADRVRKHEEQLRRLEPRKR